MTIILPDGTSQSIPDFAMKLSFYGQTPSFQADFVTRQTAEIDADNARAKAFTLGEYANWKTLNTGNREYGRPITDKPIAAPSFVFHSIYDKDRTLYFWQSQDGPPVVDYPCPDLDPQQPHTTSAVIGRRLGDPNSPTFSLGKYFASEIVNPQTHQELVDQTPADTVVHGQSVDKVTGTFQKIASMFGGGYWYLLSEGA